MRQFIKFGIVGFSNTLINYIVYIGSLRIFERNHLFVRNDYFIASVFGFVISVFWSFYWNNCFTFKLKENEKRMIGKSLFRTFVSYVFTGLMLNNLLLYIFISRIGVAKEIAPIMNLVITIPLNYMLNKLWAFKSVVVNNK